MPSSSFRPRWRALLVLSSWLLGGHPGLAQQPLPADGRTLTLEQAIALALEQNQRLAVVRETVEENRFKEQEVRAKYFPAISANALGGYNTNKLDITIPRGAMGVYPATGPIPGADVPVVQGSHTVLAANLQVAQPLTQLLKVRTGVQVARADQALAQTQVRQAEWQVRQGVEKLYYGLLITAQQLRQQQLRLQAAEKQRYDAESARLAGKALPAQLIGAAANVADQQQQVLKLQNQLADYTADLNQALNLPPDTPLTLAPPALEAEAGSALETYLAQADTANLDNRYAAQTQAKAQLGVKAARQQYLPDLALTANYVRLNGLPLLPKNSFLGGAQLSWSVYDFGGRQAVVNQRRSQQRQAEANQRYVRQQVTGDVQKAYRQLQQAVALIQVAQQAVALRQAELTIKQDALAAGKLLPVEVLTSEAALAQSQADLLGAQLNYRLALTELDRLAGTPR